MLWLITIFILGGSYLYYQYTCFSNKKAFFRSSLFRSVAGSVSILILAILFVNMAAPKEVVRPPVETLPADSLTAEEADTSYYNFRLKGAAYHYHLLKKVNVDYLISLRSTYQRFVSAPDAHTSSMGHFGLGVIYMELGEAAQAYDHFHQVAIDTLPYLHFCLGDMLLDDDKIEEAETEYLLELKNKNGNRTPAFMILIELFSQAPDYDRLYKLLQYEQADALFPGYLARLTLLHAGDIKNYARWAVRSIVSDVNPVNFMAALLISAIWLIYMFRLDIFKPEKFISLFGMFCGGMLCVILILPVNDAVDIHTGWSINDNFFNDLAYSIFMIGVPEEFVKLLPLLILLLFTRSLKEPIDYIIYGAAGALGFAFVENLLYFREIEYGVIHGRAYLSVIGHMVDTSFAAYGFVLVRFKLKRRQALWYLVPLSFFTACVSHGLYDFFLFQGLIIPFFIFFILIVQFWIIVINNCMNNSSHFTYRLAPRVEQSRIFITLGLTSIFAVEYLVAGFLSGSERSNLQLLQNSAFAGFFIAFYSSNLSNFNLIKGYWRKISFISSEKRGYGSRQPRSLLVSWYFVNAVRAHNYVGLKVRVYNDPYNYTLGEVLDGVYPGQITNRIILYEDNTPDPHWFLVKMARHIPFASDRPDYIMVKLRYHEDSLLHEGEVQVFFKAIHDANLLRTPRPQKDQFPFYGWAYIALDTNAALSGSNNAVR